MELFNKNIKMHKGETFSIKFTIRTENNEPYIIYYKIDNPYFLLSISDSAYEQSEGFVRNYWLSLENVPKFELTRPFNISDLKNSSYTDQPKYTDWNEVENSFKTSEKTTITGYYNGESVEISPEFAVFYLDGKGYKYYDSIARKMVDYNLDFVKTFTTGETSDLVSQNYYYNVQLVSGTDTKSYLETLAENNNVQYDEDYTKEELYELLLSNKISLPKNFDIEQPVGKIDLCYPILSNGKIQVVNLL